MPQAGRAGIRYECAVATTMSTLAAIVMPASALGMPLPRLRTTIHATNTTPMTTMPMSSWVMPEVMSEAVEDALPMLQVRERPDAAEQKGDDGRCQRWHEKLLAFAAKRQIRGGIAIVPLERQTNNVNMTRDHWVSISCRPLPMYGREECRRTKACCPRRAACRGRPRRNPR